MNSLQLLFIGLLLIMNVVSYSTMSDDKRRAKKHQRRVPERKLFLLSACGGALGTLIAMKRKRHKTKHLSFQLGIPLLLVLNIFVYSYLITLAR